MIVEKAAALEEKAKSALYQEAENKTNLDNVKCLLTLAVILLSCELLNEIGVFQLVPLVMRLGAFCGTVCYLTPGSRFVAAASPVSQGSPKRGMPQRV